jgi:ElaB/YqjD/DUF883 family membrane-anchored ribosome-binding protein
MPIEELEKPATIDEVRNEISKIKGVLAEAVDDGVRTAVRAMKQGRYAAEEAIEDARHVVRKNPVEALGIAFVAGVMTGCLAGWISMRRREEVKP